MLLKLFIGSSAKKAEFPEIENLRCVPWRCWRGRLKAAAAGSASYPASSQRRRSTGDLGGRDDATIPRGGRKAPIERSVLHQRF